MKKGEKFWNTSFINFINDDNNDDNEVEKKFLQKFFAVVLHIVIC